MKRILAALILLSAATNVFADNFNAVSVQGQLTSSDPVYDVKVHILSGGDVVGTASDISLIPDADGIFSTQTYITNPWVFRNGTDYTMRLSTGTSPLTVISTFSITAVPFALTVRGDAQTGDQNLFGAYGNVGIGTSTPTYRLVVSSGGSNIMWVSSAGVHATKFYGDGSGLTGLVGTGDNLGNHIATTTLNMSGNSIANAENITAARYQILGSTVLSVLLGNSLGVGINAGRTNTGWDNLFVGNSAGYSNTYGSSSLFSGSSAGYSNTSGSANTFVGNLAGYSNTSGSGNSFFGEGAGEDTANGLYNTFVGEWAGNGFSGGAYNTFVGNWAVVEGGSGDQNTIIGGFSGWSNAGSSNTFLGYTAGYTNTSGSSNIAIGAGQELSSPSASSELNIGGVIFGNLSNKTIGISTRTPRAALDIVSTGTATTQFAQIWRDSAGVVKSSMSATGVLMAGKFIGDGSGLTNLPVNGDNLGNHVATTTLNMAGFGISNAGSVVASTYYGDGSNLTGIAGGDVYKAASQTFTGQNVFTAPARFDSTMSVTANAFSVGGSTFVVSGGRVGVGASPQAIFSSIGDYTDFSGTGRRNAVFSDTTALGRGVWLGHDTSGAIGLIGAAGAEGSLAFWTNNSGAWSEKIRISSTGAMGIGTATPGSKLHVVGDTTISTSLTASSVTAMGNVLVKNNLEVNSIYAPGTFGDTPFVLGATGPENIQDAMTIVSTASQYTAGLGSRIVFRNVGGYYLSSINGINSISNNAYGALTFATDPGDQTLLERLRIDHLGNVGIGNTSPAYRLDVSGDIHASGVFRGDGSALTGVTASGAVQKAGDTMTGPLTLANGSTITVTGSAFSVGGSTLVVSNGNVGIGGVPDRKLLVAGDITVKGSQYIGPAGAPNGFIQWEGGNYWTLRNTNTYKNFEIYRGASGVTPFYIDDNNASIFNVGNVGIGTTSPGSKLHVNGDITSGNITASALTTTSNAGVGGSLSVSGNAIVTGNAIINTGSSLTMNAGSASLVPALVLSNTMTGGRSIDFTTPQAQPIVAQIQSANDGGYGNHISFYTKPDASGPTGPALLRMKIAAEGPVTAYSGITAPSITANGNVSALGLIMAGNPAIQFGSAWGASEYLSVNHGGSTIFTVTSKDGLIGGNGYAGIKTVLPFQANDGAIHSPGFGFAQEQGVGMYRPASSSLGFVTSNLERVRIDNAGNVGIGTTLPDQKLTVSGNVSIAGNIISSGTAANYFKGPIYGGVNSGVALQLASDGGNNQSFYIGNAVDTLKIGVYDPYLGGASIGTIGAMPLVLGVSNVEAMRIINGGNIGIGDTTPTARLVVNGNIVSSGTVQASKYYGDGATLSNIAALNSTHTFTGTNTFSPNVTTISSLTVTGSSTFDTETATTSFHGYVDIGLEWVAGTPAAAYACTATCSSGKYIISGGCSVSGGAVAGSRKTSNTVWTCNATVTNCSAFALCGRVKW